ncbi:MAG: lysine--tRNA ligase [Chitinispirillales bacterium]|jgi:lysyl-tRNA synthetase class 2|nr:lysine--tRNA ligase [Chitinispirillales bacterium]
MSKKDFNEQMQVRFDKIAKIKEHGEIPYAERFETTHTIAQAALLPDNTENVSVAGRLVALRYFGKLAFGHIYGFHGKIQFALQKNVLGENFAFFKEIADVGDFIGITGKLITTHTGEKTIDVQNWKFLSKTLRNLPEKFHGISDDEIRLRKRYLDLISNEETLARFKTRTKIIRTIRDFLNDHDFQEIDTPVLTNHACGAMARPFITHNNALDIDVFLRIAPETYLKRAIAGGFERVYEFARSFRNEGVDASHLPDFTLLEYYAAYWNYEDNMNFTEKLLKHLLFEIKGTLGIEYDGEKINFEGAWERISFRDLIFRDCGINIYECSTKEDVLAKINEKKIVLDTSADIKKAGRGTLIDLLYKKVSRPKIINPTFIIKHPIDLSPLARRNDVNPLETDRFQLVVNGWEVINAYSELIDPIDQEERFIQQAQARADGDLDAMDVDYDFLQCIEYGLPPISGWGMGVDRIIALLTNTQNLRDVVLFPLLRPENFE